MKHTMATKSPGRRLIALCVALCGVLGGAGLPSPATARPPLSERRGFHAVWGLGVTGYVAHNEYQGVSQPYDGREIIAGPTFLLDGQLGFATGSGWVFGPLLEVGVGGGHYVDEYTTPGVGYSTTGHEFDGALRTYGGYLFVQRYAGNRFFLRLTAGGRQIVLTEYDYNSERVPGVGGGLALGADFAVGDQYLMGFIVDVKGAALPHADAEYRGTQWSVSIGTALRVGLAR